MLVVVTYPLMKRYTYWPQAFLGMVPSFLIHHLVKNKTLLDTCMSVSDDECVCEFIGEPNINIELFVVNVHQLSCQRSLSLLSI